MFVQYGNQEGRTDRVEFTAGLAIKIAATDVF
jgi:hypothetical protein